MHVQEKAIFLISLVNKTAHYMQSILFLTGLTFSITRYLNIGSCSRS